MSLGKYCMHREDLHLKKLGILISNHDVKAYENKNTPVALKNLIFNF